MKKLLLVLLLGAFLLSGCGLKDNSPSLPAGTNPSGGSISNPEQPEAPLENLVGEYAYTAEGDAGRLVIQKTDGGYDISDYESESSYRFLADSSNIEAIENGRIYLKYPEQVFSDGAAVFRYYILEYRTDEITVYCADAPVDGQTLAMQDHILGAKAFGGGKILFIKGKAIQGA